ncbi:hypothetical protein J6590_037261 [Homalodisca vitripennis]|nr:hypothetical protein J6590_037261 [Homalodisca vitripennis]
MFQETSYKIRALDRLPESEDGDYQSPQGGFVSFIGAWSLRPRTIKIDRVPGNGNGTADDVATPASLHTVVNNGETHDPATPHGPGPRPHDHNAHGFISCSTHTHGDSTLTLWCWRTERNLTRPRCNTHFWSNQSEKTEFFASFLHQGHLDYKIAKLNIHIESTLPTMPTLCVINSGTNGYQVPSEPPPMAVPASCYPLPAFTFALY